MFGRSGGFTQRRQEAELASDRIESPRNNFHLLCSPTSIPSDLLLYCATITRPSRHLRPPPVGDLLSLQNLPIHVSPRATSGDEGALSQHPTVHPSGLASDQMNI